MKVMNTMFGQMQTQTTCGTCQGIGKVADKIPAGANAQGLIKDEEEVKLTNKELDLLCLLCECNNQTVTYETIQAIVWNDSFMSEDAIRSVARNLRKKLPVKCLENLSKIGYKIVTID